MTPVYSEYCEWFATPTPLREPKYQYEFAKLHGVSRQTLLNYTKLPEFWGDVWKATLRWAVDRNADVIGAVYLGAVQDRNPHMAKIWLEYVMKISNKVEVADPENHQESWVDLMARLHKERQNKKNSTL